jgi:hypothetical protein
MLRQWLLSLSIGCLFASSALAGQASGGSNLIPTDQPALGCQIPGLEARLGQASGGSNLEPVKTFSILDRATLESLPESTTPITENDNQELLVIDDYVVLQEFETLDGRQGFILQQTTVNDAGELIDNGPIVTLINPR